MDHGCAIRESWNAEETKNTYWSHYCGLPVKHCKTQMTGIWIDRKWQEWQEYEFRCDSKVPACSFKQISFITNKSIYAKMSQLRTWGCDQTWMLRMCQKIMKSVNHLIAFMPHSYLFAFNKKVRWCNMLRDWLHIMLNCDELPLLNQK